jgi:exoribonuclease-2
VQGLGSGTVTVGIHIAAPAWRCSPARAIDNVARARMSTVYMPGHKITMLPDEVVKAYTLLEGGDRPAVSLYARFDEATLELQDTETRLERVPIVANLRHDQLDAVVTQPWLEDAAFSDNTPEAAARLRAPLSFLFRLAKQLKAQREVVRGKPENFNRPDYNFRLVGNEGEPDGSEQVQISTRQRGAPLDLIVSEAMILANSSWGSGSATSACPASTAARPAWRPASRCAWARARCRMPAWA